MAPHFRSHTLRTARAPRKPVGLNIIDFVEHRLGFHPDPRQHLILTSGSNRVILNCTRQWGKSTVSAAKAVHRAFTVPKSLIVVASPCLRQSNEWMRRAAAMLVQLGIRPRSDGCNPISLLLPNGSRIVGLPKGEANVRGFSGLSILIVDEAARVSDQAYYEALRPMLSFGNGGLWLLSTPCGQSGFFYETWRGDNMNAQAGGSVVRGKKEEWLRISVSADQCPRISPEFLAEQRSVMTGDAFGQEHMCEFNGSRDAVFDPALIEAAMDDDLEPI